LIKFIIGFERAEGLTRQECQQYLADAHGKLVASVPEFRRHVLRYVQNFAIETPAIECAGFDADGAAELWFDNMATFLTAFGEPRYLELIRPDELRFAHPHRLIVAFTQEHTVFATACAKNLKLFRFLTPAQGISPSAFRSAWREHYAERLATDATVASVVTRYVQNWSVPANSNPFPLARPFAGIDQFCFCNEAGLHRFVEAERELLTRSGAAALVDGPACIAFAATDKVVLQ
jgi:hypothetical protein